MREPKEVFLDLFNTATSRMITHQYTDNPQYSFMVNVQHSTRASCKYAVGCSVKQEVMTSEGLRTHQYLFQEAVFIDGTQQAYCAGIAMFKAFLALVDRLEAKAQPAN